MQASTTRRGGGFTIIEGVEMAKVPGIEGSPTTDGFIRSGRETALSLEDWRDVARFNAGPCDGAESFPNQQSLCDDLLPDDVSAETLKTENDLYQESFYPWPIVNIISCIGDDIVTVEDRARATNRLVNNRSALMAKEFSNGRYSGSPSLRSDASPISTTAYSLRDAIARGVEARVNALAEGPHFVHLPVVLKPLADELGIVSNDVYTLVFDAYDKTYVPTQNTIDGGIAAVAPTANQAWIGVTGRYEYGYDTIATESVNTLDAKRANKKLVRAEQQVFYRFETCDTFLVKTTVFS